MAELASGTVSSLLGVIRSELDLLGRVRADVLFMKEEMESMKSFLAHLSMAAAPPGGAHNDQVRTWMNQVRRLALDCNHCIDLYLTRSNPEILRARGRPQRYIFWLPWFLSKTVAQHRAAVQLRELKERARDVSERRSRYAVEAPPPVMKEASSSAPAGEEDAAEAEAEAEDGDDNDDELATGDTYHSRGPRRSVSLFEVPTLDDYFTGRLAEWIDKDVVKGGYTAGSIPSIAIVAPAAGPGENAVEPIAGEALEVAVAHFPVMVICVDVPDQPLEPDDILWHTLQELSRWGRVEEGGPQQPPGRFDWHADLTGKMKLIEYLQESVRAMELDHKIDEIKEEIRHMKLHVHHHDRLVEDNQLDGEPLSSLILLLLKSATAAAAASAEQDQLRKTVMNALAAWYNTIIAKTAKRLKELLEGYEASWIDLNVAQYQRILCEVFPKTSNSWPLQAPNQDTKHATKTAAGSATASIEDQIKEMIHRVNETLIKVQAGLQLEDKPDDKKEATATSLDQDEIHDALIKNEAIGKVEELKKKIKKQMLIKGVMNLIKTHVENSYGTLIIFKLNHDRVYEWEEIRDALSLLGCIAGVVIVTTGSKDTQRHKEYCYPLREPIDYSLVGLYHDTVLKLTRQQRNADNSSYDPQVYRNILDECGAYEFCMKIFAHSLYSNPKRSNVVLHRLHNTLKVSPKSLGSIAEKMLTFSYDNLPEEYKFCLIYLAIFPRGHRIRRSVLVGRWVAEGFIIKEDWPTSVCQAERCFDVLVKRRLVYPADIGATGAVKSCMVGALVHEFITKIAKKQCILETNISHRLARHFSIFSDLQLRASDSIGSFLSKLNKSPDFYLLKVLDLEGCQCFGWMGQHFLKDICRKMLLLKYLSLRNTDVVHLPSEINNLHELEVLDIRQTNIAPSEPRNIWLLKLKRLLAGHIDPRPIHSTLDFESTVMMPERIDKMLDMEVLSNVKAQCSQDLRDIGKLWQLRKLSVVIKDKESHLKSLFGAISDLRDCLHSLSIIIPRRRFPDARFIFDQECPPMVLESLSITGTTHKVRLLPWLAREYSQFTKITLSYTLLMEDDLEVLSKLSMLCCLRLRQTEYTERNFTFKGGFQKLKYFLIEGGNIHGISFDKGATPKLEKITLPLRDGPKLCGVDNLPNLKELELNNNSTSEISNFTMPPSLLDDAKQIAKVTLRCTMLKQQDLRILEESLMPNIRCLMLLEDSCDESQLTFNQFGFLKLNVLIVNCPNITRISFTAGSCPKLEKLVWTFTKMESLSSIGNLPRLKELELKGEFISKEVKQDISKHKNTIYFTHYKPY